jgi:hypothetical protein
LGCDAPKNLLDYIMLLFEKKAQQEPIDYILLNGDLVGHKIAQDAT